MNKSVGVVIIFLAAWFSVSAAFAGGWCESFNIYKDDLVPTMAFLNKNLMRLDARYKVNNPHKIEDGDRLQVVIYFASEEEEQTFARSRANRQSLYPESRRDGSKNGFGCTKDYFDKLDDLF